MNKTLITYFSCSSNTRNVALKLKEVVLGGDIFEIEPSIPYTDADLNWENENSRSSIEMKNASARPDIKNKINIADYETIYLGFPIWWYTAPRIINTFLESYDFTNKKVYLFATSGGSNLDNTYLELTKLYPNINFIKTRVFSPSITTSELEKELNN